MHGLLARGAQYLNSGRRELRSLPPRSTIAKFDPEDVPTVEEIDAALEDGDFDAVQLGGTDGITLDEMRRTYEAAEAATDMPVYVEPGDVDHVSGDAVDLDLLLEPDAFTVPTVRNTADGTWTVGKQNDFNAMVREELDGNYREVLEEAGIPGGIARRIDEGTARRYVHGVLQARMVPEAYIVLNPESGVGEVSGADDWVYGRDDVDRAVEGVVDALYQQAPGYDGVVYFEGSGGYAPPHTVERGVDAIRDAGGDPVVWYGGGIGTDVAIDALEYRAGEHPEDLTTAEQKELMFDAGVDAVLVGNAIQ